MCSLFPDDAVAVIYKPSRSAMTSGKARTLTGKLRFEPRSARLIEPLMGWTSSEDTLSEVELSFPTMQAALAYARRQGLQFVVRGLDDVGGNIWKIDKHKPGAAAQQPYSRSDPLERENIGVGDAGQSSSSNVEPARPGCHAAIVRPSDSTGQPGMQPGDPESVSRRTRRSYEVGHRPKLLVPVDETSDCRKAVHYASRRAARIDGRLVLVRVIEPCPPALFGIGEIMQAEALQEAKELLQSYATLAQKIAGALPETVIRQGDSVREVLNLITTDQDIAILVLAAGTNRAPGVLVAELARNVCTYPVPTIIVPAHLTDGELDALS
jgi:nucleotide-binding universal stress UspA family protein